MKKSKEKINLFTRVEHSRTFRNICKIFNLRECSVFDIGCGHGQYLRNFGEGSLGITTVQEEVDFGRANNLPIILGNAEDISLDLNKKFDAIWANNLYEHLLSPHAFLMNLKKISDEETKIILGVPVVPKIVSLMNLNRWRGALASNHVNFFTHTTLRLTVESAGWQTLCIRPFIFKNHFLDVLLRPIVPHVYVVARNNANFKYPPKKLGEWIGDEHYKKMLSVTKQNA